LDERNTNSKIPLLVVFSFLKQKTNKNPYMSLQDHLLQEHINKEKQNAVQDFKKNSPKSSGIGIFILPLVILLLVANGNINSNQCHAPETDSEKSRLCVSFHEGKTPKTDQNSLEVKNLKTTTETTISGQVVDSGGELKEIATVLSNSQNYSSNFQGAKISENQLSRFLEYPPGSKPKSPFIQRHQVNWEDFKQYLTK
jgi:hypothetical protein